MKKRLLALSLTLCLVFSAAGCGTWSKEAQEPEAQMKIVCTIFPEYDWVRQILGERAEETEGRRGSDHDACRQGTGIPDGIYPYCE